MVRINKERLQSLLIGKKRTEVARQAGISPSKLHYLTSADRTHAETLVALSRALGVSQKHLEGDPNSIPPSTARARREFFAQVIDGLPAAGRGRRQLTKRRRERLKRMLEENVADPETPRREEAAYHVASWLGGTAGQLQSLAPLRAASDLVDLHFWRRILANHHAAEPPENQDREAFAKVAEDFLRAVLREGIGRQPIDSRSAILIVEIFKALLDIASSRFPDDAAGRRAALGGELRRVRMQLYARAYGFPTLVERDGAVVTEID